MKLRFVSNVSKVHTLSSVFGQEDPSDFPRGKADRALDYDRKLQSELMKEIDQADTDMILKMALTTLEKFNKYTMRFNDEAVINYLQKKMESEMKSEIEREINRQMERERENLPTAMEILEMLFSSDS